MRCEDLEARLTEFLEGELDAATEAAALDHVAGCPRCDTVLRETRVVIDLAGRHGRDDWGPEDADRVLGRIVRAVSDDTP